MEPDPNKVDENGRYIWSAARIEELRSYMAENLTARQIAARMEGVSRNAILGKIYRLRESFVFSPALPRSQPQGRPPTPTCPRPTLASSAGLQPLLVCADGVELGQPEAGLLFMDLKARHCRRALGPEDAAMVLSSTRFCGERTDPGSSWCSACRRIIYTSATAERPARMQRERRSKYEPIVMEFRRGLQT